MDTFDRLIRIGMALERQLVAVCDDLQLNRSEADVLAYLLEHSADPALASRCRVSDIARAFQLRPPTVSRTLTKLSSPDRGLVTIAQGGTDRRERYASLSEPGRKLAEQHQERVAALTNKLCKGIRPELHNAIDLFENRLPGVRRRRKRSAPADLSALATKRSPT